MIHRAPKHLRVRDFLADIQDAIALINTYLGNMTAEQFVAGSIEAHKTRDSVIKNMIDIGEAANNIMQLAPDIEQRNTKLWQHLRGAYDMRIKLTHGYRSVNDRVIWNTVTDYLPELRAKIAEEQSFGRGES